MMAKRKPKDDVARFPTTEMKLSELRDHPKNYRQHTEDQLAHIKASLTGSGVYRNVVVAKDGTILAGHGVIKAAHQLGMESFPVIQLPLDYDSPDALKVLTGDNEIARMAMQDDRALTELLKEITDKSSIEGLLGTGYDGNMLAALAMVSRPKSEINDIDEAKEWTGMPEFEPQFIPWKLSLCFETEEERKEMIDKLGVIINNGNGKTASGWYPPRPIDDVKSVRFEEEVEKK